MKSSLRVSYNGWNSAGQLGAIFFAPQQEFLNAQIKID
jgi:hypothetical protein